MGSSGGPLGSGLWVGAPFCYTDPARMLGIGFWEMLVIAGLILLAVGPDRLPAMVKTVAKFYRQFRRTAEDLRASTGIDDILRDEELKELAELRKQKLDLLSAKGVKPLATPAGKPLAAPPGKPLAAPSVKAAEAGNPAEAEKAPSPVETGPTIDHGSSGQTAPSEDPGHAMLGAPIPRTRAGGVVRGGLDDKERAMEVPPEGVDVFEARRAEPEVTEDELRLRKARIASKNTGRSVEEILAEDAAAAATAGAS